MAREIVVELPRTAYYTGEVIEGTVVVEASRDVSSRGLYVDFTGTEETVITRQQGKESRTYRSSATVVQWRLPLRGEGILPAGTFRFPFRFQIPLHGLPSYAGRHAKVKYVLTARLDVPLWVDTTWSPVHVRDPHPRGRRVELPRDVFILQLCPPRRPRYRMGIRHRGADADRDRAMRPWNGRWREAQVNLK